MLKNYHTHTWRCHHAEKDERAYIEAAIKAGVKVLGFSDHVPMPGFPIPGYYSAFRMLPEQLPEYMDTLLALRREYAADVRILIGFEAEYYPELFDGLLEFLRPYPYDYLLQGQHFLENEYERHYAVSKPTDDPEILRAYARQVVAGMRTGAFAYLAHPDIARFDGSDADYAAVMAEICKTAKELDMPLECNLLGVRDHRWYPTERFFRLAAQYGCKVILGYDAHAAAAFAVPAAETEARALLARCGITEITDEIRLRGDGKDGK